MGPHSDGQWLKMNQTVTVIGMTLCQICLSVIYKGTAVNLEFKEKEHLILKKIILHFNDWFLQ